MTDALESLGSVGVMALNSWHEYEPIIRASYFGDPDQIIDALQSERAFLMTRENGLAVLMITTDDYGDKELFLWLVVGIDVNQYCEDLKTLARELGCKRVATMVQRRGLLRLLPRLGWRPRSVELVMEI